MKNLIAEARSLLGEAKAIEGPKLTDVQIDLMSKYFTASDGLWGGKESLKSDPKEYALQIWQKALQNHGEAGHDLEPERKSLAKMIKRDSAHWVATFEREVGPIDKLV